MKANSIEPLDIQTSVPHKRHIHILPPRDLITEPDPTSRSAKTNQHMPPSSHLRDCILLLMPQRLNSRIRISLMIERDKKILHLLLRIVILQALISPNIAILGTGIHNQTGIWRWPISGKLSISQLIHVQYIATMTISSQANEYPHPIKSCVGECNPIVPSTDSRISQALTEATPNLVDILNEEQQSPNPLN